MPGMEPPSETEAEPQPLAEASAAAPLRAPEVARLREEQEKVTGRRAWFRPWPASACGRDSEQPLNAASPLRETEIPTRELRSLRPRGPREKLLSRAFVVFCR